MFKERENFPQGVLKTHVGSSGEEGAVSCSKHYDRNVLLDAKQAQKDVVDFVFAECSIPIHVNYLFTVCLTTLSVIKTKSCYVH
jgi:hypothetical protein